MAYNKRKKNVNNVAMKATKGKLNLEIDLTKDCGESEKGNKILAKSDFWENIEADGRKFSIRFIMIEKKDKKAKG